jgi:hypothetical protein
MLLILCYKFRVCFHVCRIRHFCDECTWRLWYFFIQDILRFVLYLHRTLILCLPGYIRVCKICQQWYLDMKYCHQDTMILFAMTYLSMIGYYDTFHSWHITLMVRETSLSKITFFLSFHNRFLIEKSLWVSIYNEAYRLRHGKAKTIHQLFIELWLSVNNKKQWSPKARSLSIDSLGAGRSVNKIIIRLWYHCFNSLYVYSMCNVCQYWYPYMHSISDFCT